MAQTQIGNKSFVVTRRIWGNRKKDNLLEDTFFLADQIYNDVLAELERIASLLLADTWYQKASKAYAEARKAMDEAREGTALYKEYKRTADLWENELNVCKNAYGFSEYAMHAYVAKLKRERYGNKLGINIMQKIATAAWLAEKKVFYGNGKQVHYRKVGGSMSFEDKKASTGIIYKAEGQVKGHPHEHVYFNGVRFNLKPVRKKDYWLQEAMTHEIKYCRIIRRPCDTHYHYFLQLVMDGEPPVKHRMGKKDGGLDPGVSTMTFDTPSMTVMEPLSPDIAKYLKEIKTASIVYERRRRMANPQNYNEDGTVKKDTKNFKKTWKHTRGMQEAVMRLKTAYRKKAEYVEQSNNQLANRILKQVSVLIIEPMDYRALAKRVKETCRQDKMSEVKQKDGTVKLVKKYKRRKRFGSSILKHAPGAFIRTLENKICRQGGLVYEINPREFKASQYDHEADAYRKHTLSERTREIGGHLVQRDCYSAFLIRHATDNSHPDREACSRDFKNFLKNQGKTINKMICNDGDPTGNFGLSDFLSRKSASHKKDMVTC